jgi:hypothetical protein
MDSVHSLRLTLTRQRRATGGFGNPRSACDSISTGANMAVNESSTEVRLCLLARRLIDEPLELPIVNTYFIPRADRAVLTGD